MALVVIPAIIWGAFSLKVPILLIVSVLVIESILLAFFSFRIGQIMHHMTGEAPNMRFINAHIVNMVLLCVGSAVQSYINIRVTNLLEDVQSCE